MKSLKRLFSYFVGTLAELITLSRENNGELRKMKLSQASATLVAELKSRGIVITEEYAHVVDNNAIRHTLNSHSGERELLRGQVPLTEELLLRIPQVFESYDQLMTTKNKRGQDVLLYSKTFPEGITVYVEEVRCGRKELAMDTMYIHKTSVLTDANS